MNKELNKRLFTSVLLISLLFLMLQYSVVLISSLLLIFIISWIEINSIFEKILNKNNGSTLQKFFIKFLIFLYLLFFIKVVIDDFLQNQPNVSWNLIFIITICILSDIGGYIFGKIFKGPKLTKISPKKTYSGVIGGYLLSIVFLNLFFNSFYYLYPKEMTSNIFIFILLISTVSQLGDIIISYFKRLSKIKDTGKIIPGHGGLLDRIDGMIFAFPFCYGIFSYFY